MKIQDAFNGDPYESLSDTISYQRGTTQKTIESTFTDVRSGAVYRVEERLPEGPQGDFRVSQDASRSRFNQIMGIDTRYRTDIPEDYEENTIAPESKVNDEEIEKLLRNRIYTSAKQDFAIAPSRETPEWAFETDPMERPYGTVGPFGTENNRTMGPPSILRKEAASTSSIAKPMPRIMHIDAQRPDDLQERLKRQGLLEILDNAMRGLFGHSTAGHLLTNKTSITDAKVRKDTETAAHSIVNAQMLKPWQPNTMVKTDRPQKPEQVEVTVGARALETLRSNRLMPEIFEMPRAERDDLQVALGRTILNALTTVPQQASERSSVDVVHRRQELINAIGSSVGPTILKGVVPPELLLRFKRDATENDRIEMPSSRQQEMPNRPSLSDRPNRNFVSSTAPTLGNFSAMGYKSRLFDFSDDTLEDDTNDRRHNDAHLDRPANPHVRQISHEFTRPECADGGQPVAFDRQMFEERETFGRFQTL